jgi:hypothetical protein
MAAAARTPEALAGDRSPTWRSRVLCVARRLSGFDSACTTNVGPKTATTEDVLRTVLATSRNQRSEAAQQATMGCVIRPAVRVVQLIQDVSKYS